WIAVVHSHVPGHLLFGSDRQHCRTHGHVLDVYRSILDVDDDWLLPKRAVRAGGRGVDRRLFAHSGSGADHGANRLASTGSGCAVCVHAFVERVSVRPGVYWQRFTEDADARIDWTGPRRYVSVGTNDGGIAAGYPAADDRLSVFSTLGCGRPGGWERQGIG